MNALGAAIRSDGMAPLAPVDHRGPRNSHPIRWRTWHCGLQMLIGRSTDGFSKAAVEVIDFVWIRSRENWMIHRCLANLAISLAFGSVAMAQEKAEVMRVSGLAPAGGRNSVTESWGTLRFTIENLGDSPREARVLAFYSNRRDVQFGRDIWVPARSQITSWLTIGPAPSYESEMRRELSYIFFDRTGGTLRALSPTEPQNIPSRAVAYRKREPTTAILVDEIAGESDDADPLGPPDSPAAQAVLLTRTFRLARGLSDSVSVVLDPELPPTPEAFDGIDHVVLAGNRLAKDPSGRQALRHWVLRGGTLWILLDRIEPELIAPVLGDGLRFQIVDRTSLTTVRLRPVTDDPASAEAREFDYPVDLVRVLLAGSETPLLEVNGWPAAFSQAVGRGRVIFTTLGGRAWYRDRTPRDPPIRTVGAPELPVPLAPLEALAWKVHPEPQPVDFQSEDLAPLLTAEIGYGILGRGGAAVILIGFVLALAGVGLWLRRSRSPELIGLIGPAVAVVAAGAFVVSGASHRRAVPSTEAAAAVVECAPETGEAAAWGIFAVYRPESGIVRVATENGGQMELDASGLEGQPRKRIQTDLDAWHWEDLTFPAGVRMGPFRSTIQARASATAGFGPDGLKGRLNLGTAGNATDAVVLARSGAVLVPRLNPDGSFAVGPESRLPPGQYLPESVLTDRQQRRQNVYRIFLASPRPHHLEGQDLLLFWKDTEEVPFSGGDATRQFATALYVLPLQIERAPTGTRVTIPAGFCSFTAVTDGRGHRPVLDGVGAVHNHLRFQLPTDLSALEVEKATLIARVRAPGRRFTVSGIAHGRPIALHEALNPLESVRIEIADPRMLSLDPAGGLLVDLAVSGRIGPDGKEVPTRLSDPDVKWQIEELGLEVRGRVKGG